MKYRVLVTDKLDAKGVDILKSHSEIEVVEKETMSKEDLKNELKGYDAIIIRSQTKMTDEIINASEGLKLICRAGVGVDNIDIQAATKKGIIVSNAPLGNTVSTSEYAFAMMIALARKLPFAYESMKSGKWDRKNHKGVELYGKTLGLIGLGRIGTEVAKRARAFEMKVIGFDPYISEERAKQNGIELRSLEEIYQQSDFVSIHSPLTEQTRNLITMKEMKMMKPSMRLINCARGGIVHEEDLAEALEKGVIAGAAVDVYSKEPPFANDNPILKAPNCIMNPHLGASTSEAQFNVAVESAETAVNYLLHGMVVNSINMPSISKEAYQKLKGYVNLVEKMGQMISQISDGQVQEVKISCSGEIEEKDLPLVTRSALVGLFSRFLGDTVNYVNSTTTAKERGIQIVEEYREFREDYSNLISLEVTTDKNTINIWGIVLSHSMGKIVRLNEYYCDVDPIDSLLLVYNQDQPGVIGKIGTVLGKNGINIAGMKVSRSDEKIALTFINLDSEPGDKTMEELSQIEQIVKLKVVQIH